MSFVEADGDGRGATSDRHRVRRRSASGRLIKGYYASGYGEGRLASDPESDADDGHGHGASRAGDPDTASARTRRRTSSAGGASERLQRSAVARVPLPQEGAASPPPTLGPSEAPIAPGSGRFLVDEPGSVAIPPRPVAASPVAPSPTTPPATATPVAAPATPAASPPRRPAREGPATIAATGVARLYGTVLGLAGVDLRVHPGVTGLLGPNGAGKTTLLRLIAGLDRPTRGELRVLGEAPFDNAELRRRVGFAADGDVLWPDLTGLQVAELLLRLDGLSARAARDRARELLEQVGLATGKGGPGRRRVGSYSKGMKQRLKVGLAIANDPDLLLLDEPQDGLDPAGRRDLRRLVDDMASRGRTVLFSSHVLHEVEAVSDVVVLMQRGRVVAEAPISELRALCADRPLQVRIELPDPRAGAAALVAWREVIRVELQRDGLIVSVRPWDAFFARLTATAADGGVVPVSVEPLDDTLEAVFDYIVAGVSDATEAHP